MDVVTRHESNDKQKYTIIIWHLSCSIHIAPWGCFTKLHSLLTLTMLPAFLYRHRDSCNGSGLRGPAMAHHVLASRRFSKRRQELQKVSRAWGNHSFKASEVGLTHTHIHTHIHTHTNRLKSSIFLSRTLVSSFPEPTCEPFRKSVITVLLKKKMQATLFSFPETVYRLSSEISSEAHASTLAQRTCQPEARMLCTLKAQYPAANGGEKKKQKHGGCGRWWWEVANNK